MERNRKRLGKWLMIGKKGKLTGLEEETKAEYLDSAEDNFLEKKARGDQDPWMRCCRTAPMWESDASTAKDTAAPGTGCVSTRTAVKRSLAAEKAESKVGFKWRDFLRPFKALVRGARTRAAKQIKRL